MNAPDSPFSAIPAHIPDRITHYVYGRTFSAVLDPLPKSLADLLHPPLLLMPKRLSFDLTSEKSPLSVTNEDLLWLGDAWPHLDHINIGQSTSRFNLKTELLFQSVSVAPPRVQHETAVAIDMMFPHLNLRSMRPGDRGSARSGPWVNIWKTPLEIMRRGRKNYVLSETGCKSAVPEVPSEMPVDGGDRRPPRYQAHEVPTVNVPGWNVVVMDESGTESEE
ncbi:hypothetical protein LXA43DRAFT_1099781 [Ganoderma leucocontextum]|nr:hypothetical protein LXA43DRAFT_1099781 [Ganoderma leucocontextum]